jgi:hypothetical protein
MFLVSDMGDLGRYLEIVLLLDGFGDVTHVCPVYKILSCQLQQPRPQ